LTDIESLQTDLVRGLHQVTDMLWRQGETRWAEWLSGDGDLIRHGDIFGIDHLLSAFAGIGSINDLWLKNTNTFTPTIPSSRSTDRGRDGNGNDTFQALLRRVWERARLLRRAVAAQ
jgi:hypothetical protein